MTPELIAENQYVLAVFKPSGLIAHSDGRTVEPSLAEWLIATHPYLYEVGEPWVSPQGEAVRVGGLVHRLDRATSGVLLAAKTNDVFAHLKRQFKERAVRKTYLALVHGHLERDSGTIVAEMLRSSERPRRWHARAAEAGDPRAAITHWRVRARGRIDQSPVTLVEARPATGRTHQLRVHFASIGHSLAADHLYAPEGSSALGCARPMLHAWNIEVSLPGSVCSFTAAVPDDLRAAIRRSGMPDDVVL